MNEIVLARIDDRLIHGQIVTSWCKTTNANHIVIVDDNVRQDQFSQRLLKAAAPPGTKVDIFSQEEGAEKLKNEEGSQNRTILITKAPAAMEFLIDRGIDLRRIVLGGIGAKAGRSQLNKNVSASPEEIESLKRMMQKGIEIIYQLVPAENPVNIKRFIKGE
jgi:PTS system mannose-specific IIB component